MPQQIDADGLTHELPGIRRRAMARAVPGAVLQSHATFDRRKDGHDTKSVTDISTFLIVLSAQSIKAAVAKLIITIMTVALLTQNCYAQVGGGGSGGGRKQHQRKADKPTAQTPKADDKAYNVDAGPKSREFPKAFVTTDRSSADLGCGG